jgi:transcriptional regulator with XRE-family HTH domain
MRSGPEARDVFDPMRNLGVRVRDFRKERGLTQRVLACRMNVPRTYISKVEMGRVVPTLATLWRVAAALEVTVADLLSDVAERRREDEAARILADPFLAEIAQVLDKLNAVHRALILRAVRDAAGNHRSAAAAAAAAGVP